MFYCFVNISFCEYVLNLNPFFFLFQISEITIFLTKGLPKNEEGKKKCEVITVNFLEYKDKIFINCI